MKASFVINQLTFELDAEGARELFQQVAQIQEVFEAETACGLCQSEDIRYGYRVSGDYQFYELVCRKCSAQFRFGQKKQTLELFPKRTEDGHPLPNGGWSKWVPRDSEDSRPQARHATRPQAQQSNAIPEYANWDDAERSDACGRGKPVRVAGVLYHLPTGQKQYAPAPDKVQ